MKKTISLGFFLLIALFFSQAEVQGRSFCIDYSAKPDMSALAGYEMCILSPEADVDLAPGQAKGTKYLAYLSAVEVAQDASYLDELEAKRVKLAGTNEVWGSSIIDIRSPRWKSIFVDQLAKQAADKGFDGFFIDTMDSVKFLEEKYPGEASTIRAVLIHLIWDLRKRFPTKEIVLNRSFKLMSYFWDKVDGVLVESVFQTYDFKTRSYVPVAESDTKALVEAIAGVRQKKMPVYVVDYVAKGDRIRANETMRRIEELDCEGFLTTPELSGEVIADSPKPVPEKSRVAAPPVKPTEPSSVPSGLSEVKRRILVLFGSVSAESEQGQKWAADTMTAERLQMPLEWMGYEVEYLNIGRVSPPELLDDRFAGIIFDAELTLPFGGERWYVDWILRNKERGVKVLFAGGYPFNQDVESTRFYNGLGLWGTFEQVRKPDNVRIAEIDDDVMNFEAEVKPHPVEITDLRAPKGSDVSLSVQCSDAKGNRTTFDAVYATTWGGALLDPYVTFQASSDDTLSLFDPFAFLEKIWPSGDFPAPDPSTREGLRVFYSHIDGDGFAGYSYFNGTKICAEIVRDEILKKFPFPVTVSVVEANVRAMEKHQDPEQASKYEAIAKDIFRLPNVQAASHAFSHPYVWVKDDVDYIPLYSRRNLELKDAFGYSEINLEREIAGSINYINDMLLPPEKRVEVMLWSGNCRPGSEALRITQRLGVENMNGGNTVISSRHSWIANVAPRVMQWQGELQIHAANQNEFVYTNNWKGPFFGGFSQVIDTFERTESPRRLKPVNIYYHFYSASRIGSLRALQKIYHWCEQRPLHVVTAHQFAQLTRDSYQTKVYEKAKNHWVLKNKGALTTFRLNKGNLLPDMEASKGITGFKTHDKWIYVHTDGRETRELVMTDKRQKHLYLVESMGQIQFQKLAARTASFTASDLRPGYRVVLGGVTPGSKWRAKVNEKVFNVVADSAGRLRLALDGTVEVEVRPL